MSAGGSVPSIKVGKRQYELGPTLGVGGFSEVKRGIDKHTGKRVALKITYTNEILNQRDMNNQLRSVQKEIKSMKKLNHVNIVRLLGYDLKCMVEGKTAIVMVQELAPKGELFDYLMHTNKFEQPLAIAIFHQLIAALTVIHGAGIAHRDLKPENLLFDNDYNLKIVDFGFSYIYKKGENARTLMRTELGTKGYMAPEILDHAKYTEAADIFAAGVILFIMLAGFPPFQDAQTNDWWFDKLKKKKYRLFWMAHERTAKFSRESKDIIQSMLAADPNERINVQEITQTNFYKSQHPDKNGLRNLLNQRKAVVDQKKAEDRANSVKSRDTFQEAIISYMGTMPEGEALQLKNLVQTEVRNGLAGVTTKDDLLEVFKKLATSPKFKGLEKINVDEVDLSKVPDLAKGTDLSALQDTLFMDERTAELFHKAMDFSEVMAVQIDDYDPSLFAEYQTLDDHQLPLFDSHYYKTKSYKTPASLGMILYSFFSYLKTSGRLDDLDLSVDVTNVPKITIQGSLQREVEIPVEVEHEGEIVTDENGEAEIEMQTALMPVHLVLEARVFKDPNPESQDNIITFSNGNVQTIPEFLYFENELTTNREYSLLASILSQNPVVDPSHVIFEAETEAGTELDEEIEILPEEVGEN